MKLVGEFLSGNGLALAVFLALGLSPQSPAAEFESPLLGYVHPNRLQWRSLVFESAGLVSSVEARLELRRLPLPDVPWVSIPHALEPLHRPAGETVLLLEAKVDSRMGVKRKVRRESVWFDAGDGRVFQQLRYEGGEEPNQKYYRFGDSGVFRLQRGPANAAERARVEDWSEIETSSYRSDNGGGCTPMVESTTLLYIVSVVDTTVQPPPWDLCVFSRKHLYPVVIKIVGERVLSVDYVENDGQGPKRRREKRTTQILEFTLSEDPDSAAEADSFYLLGMRMPIRVFLDKESRVPIRVSGNVADYGRGELQLREAQRANPSQ